MLAEKLKKLVMKERKLTESEVDAQWKQKTPHFGGFGPHRYQAYASDYIKLKKGENDVQVCTYCLRPVNE